MVHPSGERLIPFYNFQIGKYDYTDQTLYLYRNESLYVYNLPRLLTIGKYDVGKLTDMFITGGRVYMTYNCTDIPINTCVNGFFNQFVISNFALKLEVSLSLIIFIVLMLLWKFYYSQ